MTEQLSWTEQASQNGHYLKSLQAINAKEDVEKKVLFYANKYFTEIETKLSHVSQCLSFLPT